MRDDGIVPANALRPKVPMASKSGADVLRLESRSLAFSCAVG
jgi:hypothetical protein